MAAGEVAEMVKRFAGHIRVFEDIVLPRDLYLGDPQNHRPEDYVAKLVRDRATPLDDETFDTGRSSVLGPTGDPDDIPHFDGFHTPKGYLPEYHLPALATHTPPPVFEPAPPVGPGPSGPPPAFATYAEGADDKMMDLHQANFLRDEDVLVDHEGMVVVRPDVAPIIHALSSAAADTIPDDLRLIGSDGSALAAFLAERDDRRVGTDDIHPNEVGIGHYINGHLVTGESQTTGTSADTVGTPGADVVAYGQTATATIDGHWRVGQDAVLGDNSSTNAAAIVDTNELSRAMIVGGNYYSTDAIIQTNVYRDIDTYLANGGPLQTGAISIATGHDTSTNDARFENIRTSFSTASSSGGTVNWHVDYVEHDFYDIKVVRQANLLNDNDFVQQTTRDVYSFVSTGENEQTNQLRLVDLAKHYDIIIIHGDYHGANIILQTNILLDDDAVTQSTNDSGSLAGGMTRSVTTGDNTLQNEATIRHVGGPDFQSASSDIQAIMDQVRSRTELLDPNLPWRSLAGSGDISVLFVEGDYFDINVISQVNILSDKDTLAQTTHSTSAVASGTIGQNASTGGNMLTNAAGIIDVGTVTGAQYIVGSHYHDTILVQANLVSDGNGVIYGDTQNLVPEAAAFVLGDDAPHLQPQQTTVATTSGQGDLLGHALG